MVPLINGLALYITTNYWTNPNETAKVVDNGANQPKGIRIPISRAWNDAVLFVNLPFWLPIDIDPIVHAHIYPSLSVLLILMRADNQISPVPCQPSLDTAVRLK